MTPITPASDPNTTAAYQACIQIARREAKNFYYAFLALPRAKREAICAVYAFMRHADDLSDDESRTRDQRRADLNAWLEAWHQTAAGQLSADPVFTALSDARQRFNIPLELLDQLVQGTAMDLDIDPARGFAPSPGTGPTRPFNTYATFEDLRLYCYYVASVVGLVCIRIFGYSDPQAEQLAEKTGLAFQLTNILRDVREDAERGRIYLPLEDLAHYGVRAEYLAALRDGRTLTPKIRALLATTAKRAEHYYDSGRRLLPLIDADARPALWVLIAIYHRLLRRIERRNFDVFTQRVSVPTSTRIAILLRGLVQVSFNRLLRRGPSHV
ncbi:MAG: phytoene/squalene synthase family protein [Acidobacteriaceae bacterium]